MMNTDAFRHLFDYHFAANHKVWEHYILPLTQEQFVQPINYGIGSVRNHVVHMMNVDDRWFCGLRGLDVPGWINPVYMPQRDEIREKWDKVEKTMREYLATLRDDMLLERAFPKEEGNTITLWQVLIHVVNHGTDHRAQLLRLLNEFGAKTTGQDYAYYVYGRL